MKRIANIVLLLAASVLAISSAAAAEVPPKVAGVWQLSGEATSTPSCGIDTFVNLALLRRDGTSISVDPALGTAVGETRRTGSNTYEITLFGLIPGTPGAGYQIMGSATLTGPGEFSGTFHTTIDTPQGKCTASGTISAVKLSVSAD